MQGVVTLRIKQYGENQLPVLNGKPEFLHKILGFVTPYKRGVATICNKQYGQYQVSAIQ